MQRWRAAHGQGTVEYVGLVALVAVMLALAAGLTSGGIGGHVLAGLQRALCQVAAGACPRPAPVRADLDPCPIERAVDDESLSASLALVRLASGGTLGVERGSDGRVTVTLAHGSDAGIELAVGARLRFGGRSLGASVGAGAGATWASGRAWSFANAAAARRFVAAYGRKATVGGQLLDGLRSRCSLLCDAVGWRPHAQLPEPDETFEEAGATAGLTGSLGLASAALDGTALLGRRLRRDGAATWYLRLGADAAAGLALPGTQLAAGAAGEAVLALELDPQGRPRALQAGTASELKGGAALVRGGTVVSVDLGAETGQVVELSATLDLRTPANRAAAEDVLRALSDPHALSGAVRALAGRIATDAQVDRRVYAVRRAEGGVGATVALGAKVGGAVEHTTSSLRLVRAETRLPGLPFLPRDDCRAA